MFFTSILTQTSFLCSFPQPFSRIIEGKEKDDPKTIPLKIFAKDIGNCAYVRFSSFDQHRKLIRFDRLLSLIHNTTGSVITYSINKHYTFH